METPLPLIETLLADNNHRTLSVNPEALAILKGIRKPIKSVSIVGTYRTGKSFLLNRLRGINSGFPLGSTIESKTKGIWMWVGDHPGDPSQALLLLDTEGLNDVGKGDKNHDTQLFTLAILLSSILCYNGVNAINAQSLEGLQLAIAVSEHVKVRGTTSCSEDSLAKFFPDFIWLVRDFHLELVNGRGDAISADDYLEAALSYNPKEGLDSPFNQVRSAIRNFFIKRKCFTLAMPTGHKKLKNLDKMKEDELDEDFLEQTKGFLNYVYGSERVMKLEGEPLKGSALAALVENYTKLLNTGAPLDLGNAHDAMIQQVNGKAVTKALAAAEDILAKLVLPMAAQSLLEVCMEAERGQFEALRKSAVNLSRHPIFSTQFENGMEELILKYKARNEACVSLVRLSMDDCRPYIYFELIYPRIIAYNHTYTCTLV